MAKNKRQYSSYVEYLTHTKPLSFKISALLDYLVSSPENIAQSVKDIQIEEAWIVEAAPGGQPVFDKFSTPAALRDALGELQPIATPRLVLHSTYSSW